VLRQLPDGKSIVVPEQKGKVFRSIRTKRRGGVAAKVAIILQERRFSA